MRPERGLAVFAQKAQTSPVKPGAKKEQTSATQEGRPATGRRPLPRGLVREVFCVRAGDKEQEKELAKHMKMHYEPWVIRPDPLTDEPRLYLEPLPKFKDVSLFQKKPLLLAKLQQCTLVFDFTKPSTATNRKLKTRALTDICASFDKIEDNVREEGVIPRFIEVFESNCIRRLPPPSTNASGADPDLDEDTHALEPAWAHLELVYTMFIKLMKSPVLTTTHARTFLSRQLLLRLLDMLDCEDPRERARLGVVLHVIYAKAIDCRAFLRTSIYNIFYRYMYETERFNGMSTLLLFMQKVINGFTRPVREEHIHTFQHILLPLLKVRRLNTVFQELTICIISFVDKKPELADVAIKYVLKHWPHTPSLKQLLFLELAHVLVLKMNHGTFKNNVTAIMKRLATCMESYHFQVAERAMFFFDDPRVLTFVSDCSRRCASILLPVLLKVLQQHWCEKVKFIAIQVTRVLQSVDAMAVQKCAHEIEVKQEQVKEAQQRRQDRWQRLHVLAQERASARRLNVHLTPYTALQFPQAAEYVRLLTTKHLPTPHCLRLPAGPLHSAPVMEDCHDRQMLHSISDLSIADEHETSPPDAPSALATTQPPPTLIVASSPSVNFPTTTGTNSSTPLSPTTAALRPFVLSTTPTPSSPTHSSSPILSRQPFQPEADPEEERSS